LNINLSKIHNISNLSEELLSKLGKTKLESNVRFFFKGRPLKNEEKIKDLALSNFDVILYMLIQKEEFLNQNNNNQDNEVNREEINNNLDELNENQNQNNDQNNNQRRNGGFDVFLSYGLNPEEVRTLRLIFHVTAAQESIMTGIPLDWSAEGIYQREERWLINQINGIMNRSRNGEGSNNNYISLKYNSIILYTF